MRINQKRNTVIVIAILLLSISMVAFTHKERRCTFIAFDVGQGDALFFETPAGQQMLIDGGPSNDVLAKLGRAMPFFDRSLNVVVLTHPDADHVTGLVEVVRRYHIGTFIMTGVVAETPAYKTLQQELILRHIPIRYVRAGERIQFEGGASFDILLPLEDWRGKKPDDVNNTSVVGKFACGQLTVLATDDMEEPTERTLLRAGSSIRAAVLKVAHHGSKTSSSEQLIDAVQPAVAVISVGKDNTFGHPNQEVLDRLHRRKIQLYRTDQLADVIVQIKNGTLSTRHGLWFRLW